MMNVESLGYIGLIAFALAWLPQSWETLRAGECGANTAFLALSALGSAALASYAFARREWVFFVLNTMTTLGALVNAWYRFFPRSSGHPANAARSN